MSSTTRPRSSRNARSSHSIVAVDKFIQATRDSGYKGTANAIAELIDNALQAGADRVEVFIQKTEDTRYPIEVCVCDNGAGMDPFTLRQAMRFGGSSRFNDRLGLGRYGMGLPNSSLSQARAVTVFSWVKPDRVYSCYLDVDEIAEGRMVEVPVPEREAYPFDDEEYPPSGTIVSWTRCDRLDQRRISTLEQKLSAAIGRQFRTFLWGGVRVLINGEPVQPIDPLYLNPAAKVTGGRIFGEPIEYEVRATPAAECKQTGVVQVVFSELPVHEWHDLPNTEKRRRGVSKGAGVSVVRAGREVDHGWFFLGGKRRENYDDWWRCEIRFEPVLDEAFGITHTKQQVRPQGHLLAALAPDIEAAARALNARARKAHLAVKAAAQYSDAEKTIAARDHELKPLPARSTSRDRTVLADLRRTNPGLRDPAAEDRTEYRILVTRTPAKSGAEAFFDFAHERGRLVLTINPDHPFYKRVYRPLERSEDPRDLQMKSQLELFLLAMSREVARTQGDARKVLARFNKGFSDTLATLLHGK